MYLTFSSLSLHSFYPTPSRHSSTALLSYPSLSSLSPRSLTPSSYLTRSSISPYSSPSLPPLSFHPTFPLHSLPHPFHPAPYTLLHLPLRRPHSLIYLTPLYCPTLLQLISAPSHSPNFLTYMYYYIPFIPLTFSPNPFAGLSSSHLTFSTYSPNQLRWDWVSLSLSPLILSTHSSSLTSSPRFPQLKHTNNLT